MCNRWRRGSWHQETKLFWSATERQVLCPFLEISSHITVLGRKLATILNFEMSQSLANSCKGTPLYMAPEMITLSKEERKYGKEVDIWSLGCTLIEMASGKPPWSDSEGTFSSWFKLKDGELPPIPDHLSEEAKNFLGMCLRVKPEERANVSELLQHPFDTKAPAVAPLFTHHSELLPQHLSLSNAPAAA